MGLSSSEIGLYDFKGGRGAEAAAGVDLKGEAICSGGKGDVSRLEPSFRVWAREKSAERPGMERL